MSFTLTAVQQTEFDAFVKAKYQATGYMLQKAARLRDDVVGRFIEFRKMGQIVAVPTAFQAAVTPQDGDFGKAVATLDKFTAPTMVDSVQDMTVNFNTANELAMLVAYAMGRRSDQINIDALNAGAGSTIADGGTNFTYEKFTQIWEYFEDNAVPKGERFIASSARGLQSLMQNDKFISSFYTGNRVLDRGWFEEYLGINVMTIPSMVEGGLPKAGDVRSIFAWHKMSLGMGIGHNFRTEINYIPEKTSWLINGIFSAGAVVIDPEGVIKINIDESVI